jgi:Fe-S cluster assembly ATP-binding protein
VEDGMQLKIKDLHATIDDKPILRGVNLEIRTGETHALMGPNGSGKSTLANVLLGHPAYAVTHGDMWFNGESLLDLAPNERAQKGLFLAFQYPVAVTGLTVGKFLKRALEVRLNGNNRLDLTGYLKDLRAEMDYLEIDQQFINRYLNDGFSGGEKKRMEILQMLMLKPTLAILDETDSGLDIDALRIVAKGVNRLRTEDFGSLIITHYQRILNHIQPDKVHIFYDGQVVVSGGSKLVEDLEEKGYDWIKSSHHTSEVKNGSAATSS